MQVTQTFHPGEFLLLQYSNKAHKHQQGHTTRPISLNQAINIELKQTFSVTREYSFCKYKWLTVPTDVCFVTCIFEIQSTRVGFIV